MQGLFYDELEIGAVFSTARVTVTETAIIDFAFEWDPEPFHVDRIAAQNSVFGGIVGSGLHTLMTSYRLYYNHGLLKDTALAGLGFDEVRFKRPLRPNDTIQVVTTIIEKRPTRKPDRGIVCLRIETINQEDQLVMSMSLSALVATRGGLTLTNALPRAAIAATGETSEQRFARGMEVLRKIGGEGFDIPIKRLAEVSPDLARFTVEYPYGDVISRPGLELRLRQITTVSALIAEGSVQPQLKYHMTGFLNVGGQPRELVEILFVAVAVLGFPAAINAVGIVRDIFKDKKISFEALAPMADDGTGRYQRGLATLAALTNGDTGRVTKSLQAVSPELARWTVEFAYGDLLSRDGLDARAKQIAIISMLATVGNREELLRLNIEAALNRGVKREEIVEALIQLSIYAGFPASLNAFTLANAVFKEIDQRPASEPAASPVSAPVSEGRKERLDRGLATLQKTSAAAGTAVINGFNDLAPDIGKFIVEHSYGDIFSRPALDLKTRELAACSAMAAVATATTVVPLRVHVNAALTAGATPAEVIETLLNLIPYCGYPVVQQAVKVADEEIAKRQPK